MHDALTRSFVRSYADIIKVRVEKLAVSKKKKDTQTAAAATLAQIEAANKRVADAEAAVKQWDQVEQANMVAAAAAATSSDTSSTTAASTAAACLLGLKQHH
jgi:hypothetical protein